MFHPYLREGMAEERIERLLADARKVEQGRRRPAITQLLLAARRRLVAEPRAECSGESALPEPL